MIIIKKEKKNQEQPGNSTVKTGETYCHSNSRVKEPVKTGVKYSQGLK